MPSDKCAELVLDLIIVERAYMAEPCGKSRAEHMCVCLSIPADTPESRLDGDPCNEPFGCEPLGHSFKETADAH